MVFSLFTQLCKHQHDFRTFSSSHKEVLFPPLPRPSSWSTPVHLVSTDLPFLNIAYGWAHPWTFVWLLSLSQPHVCNVTMLWQVAGLHSLLRLRNSPLSGFCLFIHLSLMSCLSVLTIMNNIVVNICGQVFLWTYIFVSLGYIPTSVIAGPYDNSII